MQSDPAPSSSPSVLSAETVRPSPRPNPAELVQRWCDEGGIEGTSLEWMLDRAHLSHEARP